MDVKIVLSLVVPGATMFTQEVCENDFKLCKEHKMRISYEENGQKKSETIVFKTRKTKDCVRKIKLTREAYDYMLDTPVEPKMAARWKSTRKSDRLRYHFDQISKDFNAKSYDYEILED